MLVRVMSEMILCGHRLFVLAILGHGGIAPLERQQAKNQEGNKSAHGEIMPDRPGSRSEVPCDVDYALFAPLSKRSPLATTIRLAPASANTAIHNVP